MDFQALKDKPTGELRDLYAELTTAFYSAWFDCRYLGSSTDTMNALENERLAVVTALGWKQVEDIDDAGHSLFLARCEQADKELRHKQE